MKRWAETGEGSVKQKYSDAETIPLWLSEEAWLHCLSGFELIARNEKGIDILLHPSLLQENKGEIPS